MEKGEQPAKPLLEQRDALIEEIFRAIPQVAPFYGTLSADAQKGLAVRMVDLYLASLSEDRSEAMRTWAVDAFARRHQQGASLGEVLRALGLVRNVLARAARALTPRDVVEEVSARFEVISAALVDAAVAGYQSNAEEATLAFTQLEDRYRAIYQCTPAMMHSLDSAGRITAVSQRWLDTLGYTLEEVLSRPSLDFLTEESRRRAAELNIPRVRVDGEVLDVPYQIVKKGGEIIDVRSSSVVVRDERGDVTRFLTVFDDVTAELLATRALRESEERWRALIDLSPLPLVVHRAGVMLWVNDALVRMLVAASPADLVGKNVIEFVHPDDRALLIQRVREGVVRDESLPPLEERYVRFDGKVIHVEVAARAVMFEGQKATQAAMIDVTARKQAEEARRLGEAQEQIIAAQEEALRALSTPLIPLDEGLLVLPLVGRVTADRAEQILEALAEGVVAQRASVAIIDVTGVPEADALFAEVLVRVARSIRLLGAEVVITGITPAIARVLIRLGADFEQLTTRGTLRDGITYARGLRGERAF